MSKEARNRVAQEAARFIVNGVESEYLDAKERAIMMLGLSSDSCRPSNRKIKDFILQLTKEELGSAEVSRRVNEMRIVAHSVMEALIDYDPFLIGSTLSGKIRRESDIDIHAYCDVPEEMLSLLARYGYLDIELDTVENSKGIFNHLKWVQNPYPVEVTIYPWNQRDIVPISSVTGKPMKRLDLKGVKQLLS